jgi:glycosyltransferase involved in cell wall biosynthesis
MGDTQLTTPRADDLQTLTILMPAHNEEQIIAAAVTEWHTEVISKLPGSRLLVVDDASTDGTPDELRRLAATLQRVEFIRRPVNGGHGQALLTGFRQIDTEFTFQTDSDRQHSPTDFWRLWELRGQFDFVFGVRSKRQDGAFRRVIATLMRALIWLLWQVWVADANCPFKLMRSQALAAVLRRIPEDAFIPMVMVAILARRLQYRVAEVSVRHLPRRGGSQSLHGLARWCRVAWLCAGQLARLRVRE